MNFKILKQLNKKIILIILLIFSSLYSQNTGDIKGFVIDEYSQIPITSRASLDLQVDRIFNFENWKLIVYADVQNVYNYKIPLRPNYDFSKKQIDDESSIGLLPSIGISAEF